MLAGVCPFPEIFFVFAEVRDKSSECTLDSGGAIFRGFILEALGADEAFETFAFLVGFGDSRALVW